MNKGGKNWVHWIDVFTYRSSVKTCDIKWDSIYSPRIVEKVPVRACLTEWVSGWVSNATHRAHADRARQPIPWSRDR